MIRFLFSIFSGIILSFFFTLIVGGALNSMVYGSFWPDQAIGTAIICMVLFTPLISCFMFSKLKNHFHDAQNWDCKKCGSLLGKQKDKLIWKNKKNKKEKGILVKCSSCHSQFFYTQSGNYIKEKTTEPDTTLDLNYVMAQTK